MRDSRSKNIVTAVAALTEQRRLLMLEYESEKRSFHELVDRIGVIRLVDRGKARYPLKVGRSWHNSMNQRVVELTVEGDYDDATNSDDGFEPGRPITVFAVRDEGKNKIVPMFAASISFVDSNRIVAVIPEEVDITSLQNDREESGVMLSFDETSYRTMFEAIDRTIKAGGRLGELRDIIYSDKKVGELTFSPLRFPYLNLVQEKAVNKVLRAKDISIVHGPPGTGKTTTLVEAIYETLRREPQVMVCAQSNMAVDWISEKLLERGVRVLRIGNPSRVNDRMLSLTYERRFEAHPDYSTLWSIRKAIRELRGARRSSAEHIYQKLDRLRSRAVELELRINNDIFSDARVVASTLVGSAGHLLEGMTFPTLFIDEAAQALEPAAWIAIRRAGRVVFAGDHCQLPPVVKNYEAFKGGFGKSLMERCVVNHPEAVTLLTMQYRMNEDLMRLSSQWFYGGMMTAAPEVRFRGILDFDIAIDWIDTEQFISVTDNITDELSEEGNTDNWLYKEQIYGAGYGRINRQEAELTLLKVKEYIEKIGKNRIIEDQIDFGIISPYRAQVGYLRRRMKSDNFFRPFRRLISVNTVDGFQGQERDVIVISMVRSNDEGQIGFLRDLRRMNVAMTRARMKLIIVGSRQTLSHNRFYRCLNEYIDSLRENC